MCAPLPLSLSLSLPLRLNIADIAATKACESILAIAMVVEWRIILQQVCAIDRIRIFHLVAPCFLPPFEETPRQRCAHPSIESNEARPLKSNEASRRRRAHSKHSAGVIPFVLDSRFLNKSAPFAPRGPLPLPRSGVYTSTPDTVPTLIDNSLLSATNGRKLEIGKLMGGGGEFFAVFFFENLPRMDMLFKMAKKW